MTIVRNKHLDEILDLFSEGFDDARVKWTSYIVHNESPENVYAAGFSLHPNKMLDKDSFLELLIDDGSYEGYLNAVINLDVNFCYRGDELHVFHQSLRARDGYSLKFSLDYHKDVDMEVIDAVVTAVVNLMQEEQNNEVVKKLVLEHCLDVEGFNEVDA